MPVFLAPVAQVWLIIALYFVMTIPGTAVMVGFNVLFAEVVPPDWRGHVFGLRMALLSIITTVFSLLSGQILDRVVFPLNYEIVFLLGFLGGAMSSVHLFLLLRLQKRRPEEPSGRIGSVWARLLHPSLDVRRFYRKGVKELRLDVLNGHFARLMGLLFAWHFFQWMVIPTITPYVVDELKMTDNLIGLAGGLFSMMTFLGSLQLNRITRRWGNKSVTAYGIMGVSFFPVILSLARGPGLYLFAQVVGGLAWSMAGGAILNYILENTPEVDRPAYLAWYSVVMNAAILLGSLIGPAIGAQIGLALALFIYGCFRFMAGAAILRWG